jgi:hypothetical protein
MNTIQLPYRRQSSGNVVLPQGTKKPYDLLGYKQVSDTLFVPIISCEYRKDDPAYCPKTKLCTLHEKPVKQIDCLRCQGRL